MGPDSFLTDDDLVELTGYRRSADQCRTLVEMGIEFFVRPDGKPRLSWGMLSGRTNQPYTLNLRPTD